MRTRSSMALFDSLIPGEPVQIHTDSDVVVWIGVIVETAPGLGVAWILTDTGERKLIDAHEHHVRRSIDGERRGTVVQPASAFPTFTRVS